MLKSGAVTIRFPGDERPEKKPGSDVLSFRAPEEFRTYLRKAAKKSDRSMARFVIEAVQLERGLSEEVLSAWEIIREHAVAEGVDMDDPREFGAMMGRLALAQLAAQRKGKR